MKTMRLDTGLARACSVVLAVSMTLTYAPLFGSGRASAQTKPGLYVLTYETQSGATPDDLKLMVQAEVDDKLAGVKGLNLLGEKAARSKLSPGAAAGGVQGGPADLKKAQGFVKKAREAYDYDEMADAKAAARKAVDAFKTCPNLIQNWKDVEEAYILHAVAAVELEDGAREAVREMLTYNPRAESADYGNKAFKKLSADERGRLGKSAVTLAVKAEPANAKIVINGQEAGSRKLAQGEHWVQVTADGYAPYAGFVKATRTMTHPVKLSKQSGDKDLSSLKDGLVAQVRDNNFDDAFVRDMTALCEALEVDYVAFVAFDSDKRVTTATAYVFRVSDGLLLKLDGRRVKHDFAGADEATAGLARDIANAILKSFPEERAVLIGVPTSAGMSDDVEPSRGAGEVYDDGADLSGGQVVLSAGDAQADHQIGEGEESIVVRQKPIYEQWWFWTIIGVVVVGGVVGTAVALQPEDQSKASTINLP